MIVKNIIYNNLLRLLKNITIEGDDFDAYYNSKDEAKGEELIKLDEGITSVIVDIKKSRLKKNIFTNFDNLINLLNEYNIKFNDYPNNRINEIILIATLIRKLDEAIGGTPYDIGTQNIAEGDFCLEVLSHPIAHGNFYYSDFSVPAVIENSLILIDLSDFNALFNFISTAPFSIDLTAILLAKLGDASSVLKTKQYALVTNQLKNKPSSIYAFVCLHITSAGYLTHKPYLYTSKPNINPIRKILPKNPYQQFNDSLMIMSEYNYHKDILDKYLRLYHLIENFMYKYPLVTLEKNHDGAVFSIRDFKKMYEEISDNEPNTLKKLFKAIFSEFNSPGISFQQYIFSNWSSLTTHLSKDKIDKLLSLLRVSKSSNKGSFTFDEVTTENISNVYSQIVYAYRNSLVHNRETEFHLTHGTLQTHSLIGSAAKDVLEKFVIPTLEEISFYLVIEKNPLVWYKASKLTLWTK